LSADPGRKLLAEALGAAFLLATVIGSGIMAERLSGGNEALALLGNTLPTAAILVVLITILAPVSGAHLNPAVTLAFAIRREFPWRMTGPYVLAQIVGALIGVVVAHGMFETPLALSASVRSVPGQWLGEAVATFGLVLTVLGCVARSPAATPVAVGLYITAAYWFTASTSFANPAVTLARAISDTFAGIAPASVPMFVMAQVIGTLVAVVIAGRLWPDDVYDTDGVTPL
jgi:glycerol uptake facilitator-like aquaporin